MSSPMQLIQRAAVSTQLPVAHPHISPSESLVLLGARTHTFLVAFAYPLSGLAGCQLDAEPLAVCVCEAALLFDPAKDPFPQIECTA